MPTRLHTADPRALLRRRGSVAILAAFFLVMLMAMVAFAIDVGYIAHARTELQRAADACALAAAGQLPDELAAIDAACDVAKSNGTSVTPELATRDVEFGSWDRREAQFAFPPPTVGSASAVRVTFRRTAASGNPLTLFFGGLLGTHQTDVVASATASRDQGLCGAFIGIDEVVVAGNIRTDSYDSRKGRYDRGSAGHYGGLCSDGPITVSGGVTIQGDVRAGQDHRVTVRGASGVITGNVGNRVKPLNMPQVDFTLAMQQNDNDSLPALDPSGNPGHGRGKGKSGQGKTASPLDSHRNFSLTGNETYTLPAGTYFFHDLVLSGQSVLNLSGETVIYLTGELKRAGGTQVNTNTQLAGNLRIYSSGGDIDISSDNDFYAVIYAPLSRVELGGTADFFGAIVARELEIRGVSQAHYDEALKLHEVALPSRVTLVE